ncbi:MAG: NAD(P)H-binding protein [Burkholderiaceae bacterium]
MGSTTFAVPPRRRNALVAGATGLVGRALLELLASERSVGSVTALVRRKVPALAAHPGIAQQIVDYTQPLALPEADDAYCCLGTTIKTAGSQEAFRAVDFTAVLAFAEAARAAGATRLGVVSALGANAKSSVFYNRVKGEMEGAVAELGYSCVILARPSLLLGERDAIGQPLRRGEQLAARLAGPFAALIPKAVRPIEARTVARALMRAVQKGEPGVWRFDSAALQKLGREA